ncbi:MAG: SBBP repeat-containing protein [Bacteroidetes bacterium]|nr:SBBP repeat-containing protein [Bacteroidota bacterium]
MSKVSRFRHIVMSMLLVLTCTVASYTATIPGSSRIVGFQSNAGQWPSHVLFLAKSQGVDVWITRTGMIFDQHQMDATNTTSGQAIHTTWVGSSFDGTIEPSGLLHTVSYFTGPQNGTAPISTVYDVVRLRNVYPGIDVVYRTINGKVRYDFDVQPGADASVIAMSWKGANGMQAKDATLRLGTFGSFENGVVIDELTAFQQGTSTVPCRFDVTRNGNDYTASFKLGAYDRSRPLTIDPIVYSSFYGGDGDDRITGLKILPNGDLVYVGYTLSSSVPSAAGGYQTSVAGGQESFVVIMDKKLSRIKAFSYLGGGNDDRAKSVAVDANGGIFVVGETLSPNFPVTNSSFGQVYSAGIDGFAVKLSADLKKLEYGGFIRGNKDEIVYACDVDGLNNLFICGSTNSTINFPTTNAYKKTNLGQTDAFLCKIAPTGATFAFSTYYGSEGIDIFWGVHVDASGSVYVTGSTTSPNFEYAPVPPMIGRPPREDLSKVPYDRTFNGGNTDAVCCKFGPDGGGPIYATFFGGAGDDVGKGLFVDELGRCWIIGETTSADLPAQIGFQQTRVGKVDLFYAGFTDDGKGLAGASYFGGTGDDNVLWVEHDKNFNAVVGGTTTSGDLPIKGTGTTGLRQGPTDGFVATWTLTAVVYCDLIGGTKSDAISAVDVDANGDLYFGGYTNSDAMIMRDSALQVNYRGGANDGFMGKIAMGIMDLSTPDGGESLCTGVNATIAWATTDIAATEKFYVEVSSDEGATWTTIANNLTVRSYVWKPSAAFPAGNKYLARVTGERGHVSRSANTFSLSNPPAITKQPDGVGGCDGKSVTMVVEASGTALKYQWTFNGMAINGATEPSYTITSLNAANSGKYEVTVTGSCNPPVTSRVMTVSVVAPTAVTTQPTGVTVEAKKPFKLSVTATGDSLKYQWKLNGSPIPAPAGTMAEYSVASATTVDAGAYTCEVSGTCGTVTSNTAEVVVTPTTGVQEELPVSSFRVLGPNPASHSVSVMLAEDLGDNGTISLIDVQGVVVLSMSVERNARLLSIPVQDLAVGSYTIQLRTSHGYARGRIVVVR